MKRIEGRGPRGLLQRVVFFFSRRIFGRTPSSLRIWAHHRRAFVGATMMEGALAGSRALPRRIHALADLAAAREIGCRYCLDIGSWVGLQKGLEPEDLAALDRAESSPRFGEAERAAICFASAMSRTPPEVDDALFERLRRSYDDEQIVELAAIVGWEQYRARINHVMGLAPDGFLDATACPMPSAATPAGLGAG